MVDLAFLQSVSYIAGALGVCIAAVYYVLNMRETQRTSKAALETRHAQLFMEIYHDLYSRELILARYKLESINNWDDFLNMWNDQEKRVAFNTLTGCFEAIGVLVRENLVDIRLVTLLSSGLITGFWKKYSPYILQYREKFGYPRLCVEFEYLNDRIAEYGKEHPDLQIVPKLAYPKYDNEK